MLDNVKAAFEGTRGKILIGGGVVLAVFLYWSRRKTSSTAGTSSTGDVTAVPGDRTRNPQSPPTVGNTTQTDTATTRPQDPETWISQCVDILSNPPYNKSATAVYNALRKALDGSPLTETERALVEDAIRVRGTPPGGMPPLNIMAPSDSGQANSPPSSTPPPPTQTIPDTLVAPANTDLDTWCQQQVIDKYGIPYTFTRMRQLNPGLNIRWIPASQIPGRDPNDGASPQLTTPTTVKIG